jgi:hypothetical protein
MRRKLAACLLALLLPALPAQAAEADRCEVPGYLIFADAALPGVAETVKQDHRLDIVVFGTGSSMLPPPAAPVSAFPGRLEAVLQRRLKDIAVTVTSQAKMRQTAADMLPLMEKTIHEKRPDLVIWQTGTVEALRGVDVEEFRATLHNGLRILQAAGVGVILMNMQYSPRTESMLALASYADSMRIVAREHDVPLFDRFSIMRHWGDVGAFDFYATSKDVTLAQQVHDCVARALASQIIEAAHLGPFETKAAK